MPREGPLISEDAQYMTLNLADARYAVGSSAITLGLTRVPISSIHAWGFDHIDSYFGVSPNDNT